MNQDSRDPLNQGQQAAADGFFQFLFDEGNELIISGPGGVGKTFLMGHLIDEIMPRYHETCALMGIKAHYQDVVMTATTNQAAEVLGAATGRPATTIHSFLNLKVTDDYATGRSILTKTANWKVHHNLIIFIDEAYMTDRALLAKLREGTHNCKIVFVGDHCQLAPIMEPVSAISTQNLPFYELTEPMRNGAQPALMRVCQQLRNTVETGDFHPIQIVPGVIDYLDNAEMEQEVNRVFTDPNTNSRILAYTNARVVAYNDHIRDIRQLTETYTLNEKLINNSAIRMRNGMLSVQEEVEIIHLDHSSHNVEIAEDVFLQVIAADIKTRFGDIYKGVHLPVDKDHFNALIKFYRRQKNWNRYFYLKNNFPDLRPRDAVTVHKAQGSTFDSVFIDLGNLSTCHNPNQAARLLYVAFTRACGRVVLYGKLADKYGGVIQ
jgi:hypothetical protein